MPLPCVTPAPPAYRCPLDILYAFSSFRHLYFLVSSTLTLGKGVSEIALHYSPPLWFTLYRKVSEESFWLMGV